MVVVVVWCVGDFQLLMLIVVGWANAAECSAVLTTYRVGDKFGYSKVEGIARGAFFHINKFYNSNSIPK